MADPTQRRLHLDLPQSRPPGIEEPGLFGRLFGSEEARISRARQQSERAISEAFDEGLQDVRRQISRRQDEIDELTDRISQGGDDAEIEKLVDERRKKRQELNELNKSEGLASLEERARQERAGFDEQVARRRQERIDRQADRRAKLKRGMRLGAGGLALAGAGYAFNAYNDLKRQEVSAEAGRLNEALKRAMRTGDVSDEDYMRLVEAYGRDETDQILSEGRAAAAQGRDLVDEADEILLEGGDDADGAGLEPTNISFMDEVRANPGMRITPEEMEDRLNAEFEVGLENLSTGLDDRPREEMNFLQRVIDGYLNDTPIMESEGPLMDLIADVYRGGRSVAVEGLNANPATGVIGHGIDLFTPATLDDFFTNKLDVAREGYQVGELSGANEPYDPVFREVLRMMGRQPLEAPATATRSPRGQAQDAMSDAQIEMMRRSAGGGQPTTPNIANAPQSLGDLMMLEQQGLLPYPGTARENAERLGIGMNGDVRPSAPSTWQPPATSSTPVPDAPPEITRPSDIDEQDAVDTIIDQDEVLNPRGQQTAPEVMDEAPVMDGEDYGGGLVPPRAAGAAWASGQDGGLSPSADFSPAPIQGEPDRVFPRPLMAAEQDDLPAIDQTPAPGRRAPAASPRPPARGARGSGNAAVGTDYETQKSADPASLADDAEEAEKELNRINTWMRDKLGMDASERSKWADSLIRMGATMMQTPGNLGEALGAGISAGLDTYQGLDQQEYEREITEQELAMREANARRDAALDDLRRQKLEADLLASGVEQDVIQAYFAEYDRIKAMNPDMPDIEIRDLARASVGLRAPKSDSDALLGQIMAGVGG